MTIKWGTSTVLMSDFLIILAITILISLSLIVVSVILRRIYKVNFFYVSLGYSGDFFIGTSIFLTFLRLLSIVGVSFRLSIIIWISIILVSALVIYVKNLTNFNKIIKYKIRKQATRYYEILILTLFMVLIIAVKPYNKGPLYELISQDIIQNDTIPVLNRHYGQSILGAVSNSFVTVDADLHLVAINLYLIISLIALLLLVKNIFRLFIGGPVAILVSLVFILGTTSLSLTPIILYDHDFPIFFNLYFDSIAGIAYVLVFFWLTLDSKNSLIYKTFIQSNLIFSLSITSELNLIFIGILTAQVAWNATQRRYPTRHATAVILVVGLVSPLAFIFGGSLTSKFPQFVDLDNSTIELGADSLIKDSSIMISPKTFYRPFLTHGNWNDYGDTPIFPYVIDGRTTYSVEDEGLVFNSLVKGSYESSLDPMKYSQLLLLFEQRITDYVRVLFVPLGGLVIWFYLKFFSNLNTMRIEKRNLRTINYLIPFSVMSFVLSEIILVFFNIEPSNPLYWKWALTRVTEVGIFFMTLTSYVGYILIQKKFKFRLQNLFSIILVILLVVPSLLRIIFDFILRYNF